MCLNCLTFGAGRLRIRLVMSHLNMYYFLLLVKDEDIKREVIVIKALVGVSNFIILPSTKSRLKSLGITGRYIYFSLSGIESTNFTIHLDFTFHKSKNSRISLSNLYKCEAQEKGLIKVPLILPKDRWVIICLDPMQYFERYHCSSKGEQYYLKSLMFCDNIKVSRVGVSDNLYDCYSLPKDLNFKFNEDENWFDTYTWIEPITCHKLKAKQKSSIAPVPATNAKFIGRKCEVKSYPMRLTDEKVISDSVNINAGLSLKGSNTEVKLTTMTYSMTTNKIKPIETLDYTITNKYNETQIKP